MSFHVVRGARAAMRPLAALLTAAAFLLALAAADAPGLHEQIHKDQGPAHECVATILSAGGIVLCGAALVIAIPASAPETFPFFTAATPRGSAPLDFLLLEHAPPTLS